MEFIKDKAHIDKWVGELLDPSLTEDINTLYIPLSVYDDVVAAVKQPNPITVRRPKNPNIKSTYWKVDGKGFMIQSNNDLMWLISRSGYLFSDVICETHKRQTSPAGPQEMIPQCERERLTQVERARKRQSK
jgi:hypothetical protein